MKEPIIVPVDQLNQEPYSSVLSFPNPSEAEVQNRINELHSHGVSALEFSGNASLFGVKVPVLGKGFVGIVAIALLNGERVAVKILRQDAGRANLLHEAQMMTIANTVNVAPRLISASKNFLLMQLIDGELLPNWLKTHVDSARVKPVLREILEQCRRLDEAGLDHGELSKAPKHVLVDGKDKPFIVDFETASVERRVANVTAICQYLFGGESSAAKILGHVLGGKNRLELIEVLRAYKINKIRSNFERLLTICVG